MFKVRNNAWSKTVSQQYQARLNNSILVHIFTCKYYTQEHNNFPQWTTAQRKCTQLVNAHLTIISRPNYTKPSCVRTFSRNSPVIFVNFLYLNYNNCNNYATIKYTKCGVKLKHAAPKQYCTHQKFATQMSPARNGHISCIYCNTRQHGS